MNAGWLGPIEPNPVATCRCRHPRDAHEHYRPGTDCSACDCSAFRRMPRLSERFGRLFPRRVQSPENPHPDSGLTALLDAVMTEQRRGPCGCMACQINYDENPEPSR